MKKDIAVLFVNCVRHGSEDKITDRIYNVSAKILVQTQILTSLFDDPNEQLFLCLLCFDEADEKLSMQERLDWFGGVKSFLQEDGKTFIEVQYVAFTREKTGKVGTKEDCSIHKFIHPEKIKELFRDKLLFSNQPIGVSSLDLQQSVPDKIWFHFRNTTFRNVDESLTVCLHDTNTLETFYESYLEEANSELITIPDFDRIELTRLYPLKPPQDKLEDYTCPGLHPGPSLYDYVGEIERFWQHFHVWFLNPKGVLMHSYSQDNLAPLLENENLFSFEFDWLFWMEDKLLVFEVSMGKNPIGAKLDQLFNRHFTILRILFYFFSHFSSSTATDFQSFFKRRVRYVIFFAEIDHDHLSSQLLGAIKGTQKYKTNTEVLDLLYFVGNSNFQVSKTPFLKFDTKGGKNAKMVSCEVDSVYLTSEDICLMNQMKSLFALGYFTTVNDADLQPFRQSPKSLDVRFRRNQKTFCEKYMENFGFNDSNFFQQLDVILSPQQFEILRDNPKMLFCPGEAGSGKTQLLLAKALQSCMDESVHSVYFCIPLPKSEVRWKRKNLLKIVEAFACHKRALQHKFHIISDRQVLTLRDKPLMELKGIVLLIDEFHYDYEESFSITKEEFFVLAMEIFPYLMNCWIANVTMHYIHPANSELSSFIPAEFLCTRPLNVQFRSAKHISEFCSNLVQISKRGKFSSPRVYGVFLSKTQQQVQISEFAKSDYGEILLSLQSKCFKKSYEKSRWVIVLCNAEFEGAWEKFIHETLREIVSESKIVSLRDGLASCVFSGGEIQSLLLIIDGPEDGSYGEHTIFYNDLIILASSRAQFELFIYVRKDIKALIMNLDRCAKTVLKGTSANVAVQAPSVGQISKFCNSLNMLKIPHLFTDLHFQDFHFSENRQILEVRKFKKTLLKSRGLIDIRFPGDRSHEYKDNRYLVVLCNADCRSLWEEIVALRFKGIISSSNYKLVILEEDISPLSIISSKVQSIFLMLDDFPDDLHRMYWSKYKRIISMVSSFAEYELIIYVSANCASLWRALRKCALEVFDESNDSIEVFLKYMEQNMPTKNDVVTLVKNCNVSYAALELVTESFGHRRKIFVVSGEDRKMRWLNVLDHTFGSVMSHRNRQHFHHDVSKVAAGTIGIASEDLFCKSIVVMIDKDEKEQFYEQNIEQFRKYLKILLETSLFEIRDKTLFIYLHNNHNVLFSEFEELISSRQSQKIRVTLAAFCEQKPSRPNSFCPLKFKSFKNMNEWSKVEQLTPFLAASKKYDNRHIFNLLGVQRAVVLLNYFLSQQKRTKSHQIFRG